MKKISLVKPSVFLLAIVTAFALFSNSVSHNSEFSSTPQLPGKYENYTLLPNGWKLTPQGKQIPIGELPLNVVITKDEKYAITTNNGMGETSLSVVDLNNLKEIQRVQLRNAWLGLTFNQDESRLYASAGNDNQIYVLNFNNGKLSLIDSIEIGEKYPAEDISVAGLAFVNSKNLLLAVTKGDESLYIIDAGENSIIKKIKLAGKCYDVKVNHAENFAYVSVWENASVAELNLNDFSISNIIRTGNHPCDIAITKNDKRLFVTNANNNSTSVIDLTTKRETERIISSLKPCAPFGSTPNSVTLSANDTKLYIANADNNYIAVFDVSDTNHSKNLGFIPTGWYPASVRYLNKTNRILVLNGKGLTSRANLDGPNPFKKKKEWFSQYTGDMFKGTVSVIDAPDENALIELTGKVYSNTPFIYKTKTSENDQDVIPAIHNLQGSKKIKYVFYIIKENRTYDQVFGDIPRGNGDSSLCLFGNEITPNEHKLALNFTLYDNFYADAEVSADGHNWSTAAYATDYVEKLWPTFYARKGDTYDFEGDAPVAAPTSGYIWNNVLAYDKTLRNYGEFVELKPDSNGNYKTNDRHLNPYTNRKYPGFDLKISDLYRFKIWEEDFDSLLENNSIPNFNIIRLPNDHAWGTRKDRLTPQAYVAQNDYAFGLMVDKISHSKIWKESIIFAVEDDAQSGSDHVDAHRSLLFVISPYVKRNYVDHTMYSTSGVLKTIELVLGLPPMTQFDLSATPILNSITNIADEKSYDVISPLIDINKKNTADAYGSKRCEEMNFTTEDAVPDVEYNEILWKAVKGRNSVMPPPVRSAFVNVNFDKDD